MKDGLEEAVDALCMYGTPHIWLRDERTWAVVLTLHTNIPGAVFELKAGREHKTLHAAISDVLQQAAKTISNFEFKIGGNAK